MTESTGRLVQRGSRINHVPPQNVVFFHRTPLSMLATLLCVQFRTYSYIVYASLHRLHCPLI